MEIKILCPLWGQEHLDIKEFTSRIKEAGYDGVDTWIPEEASARKELFDALEQKELLLVSHQHQAHGAAFPDFKDSFRHYLRLSAEGDPLLMRGIALRNFASWVETYDQCHNLQLDSIYVDSKAFWNNDGIDIVDCDSVAVTNSYIDSDDDGVCLKSHDASKGPAGEYKDPERAGSDRRCETRCRV